MWAIECQLLEKIGKCDILICEYYRLAFQLTIFFCKPGKGTCKVFFNVSKTFHYSPKIGSQPISGSQPSLENVDIYCMYATFRHLLCPLKKQQEMLSTGMSYRLWNIVLYLLGKTITREKIQF